MKFNIIISSLALMFFVIAGKVSYSQDDCCANTSSACCVEKSACCEDHSTALNSTETNNTSANEVTGNAGGDTSATVCLVSGEAIGEGQGLKFDYYGKTYNFCCEGCLAKFKKEPMDYAKNIECPVMGDPIESKEVFAMHNGTKYYVCCPPCLKSFEKNPEKYIGSSK